MSLFFLLFQESFLFLKVLFVSDYKLEVIGTDIRSFAYSLVDYYTTRWTWITSVNNGVHFGIYVINVMFNYSKYWFIGENNLQNTIRYLLQH